MWSAQSEDEPARAALLMVSDLAVIILRDQIAGVLGRRSAERRRS